MKIGILTQPLGNNYGGILQNYALHVVLKNSGHEPITFNRVKKTPLCIKYGSIIKRSILKLWNKDIIIRGWRTEKEIILFTRNTRQFINNNIQIINDIGSTKQLLYYTKKNKLEAFIVGSDQVWRPKYSPMITNYYFDFLENININKIAYAASFGVDHWEYSDKLTQKCRHLVSMFDAISVREDSAKNLCAQYLNTSAKHVLDPTLLIDKSFYVKLLTKKQIPKSKGNLFYYLLDDSEKKLNIVSTIAHKKRMLPFKVYPSQKDIQNPYKTSQNILPPIENWIKAFMDAEFVVTDSFHGTIFSIIFGKPFITISNPERGQSRFNSLLDIFKLRDRLIADNNELNIELLNSCIDYKSVYQILERRKEESLEFLFKNIH